MSYTGLTTEYKVKTTGDRWFIPVNAPKASKADQAAQCAKVSNVGTESVAN